jgi:hypothetical protein
MRLFFYGTLLDADVRTLVLGPQAEQIAITPARLAGWRRLRARGKLYPIILEAPGKHVAGIVTSPLDAGAVARLRRYEGPGYDLSPCRPLLEDGSTVAAQVFQPTERPPADEAEWDLAAWQATEKSRWLSLLRRGAQYA